MFKSIKSGKSMKIYPLAMGNQQKASHSDYNNGLLSDMLDLTSSDSDFTSEGMVLFS